jgi:hypothetical protein
MTRKDYILIAAAIRETLLPEPETGIAPPDWQVFATRRVVWRLGEQLRQDNPRFDRTRFMAACGLTA